MTEPFQFPDRLSAEKDSKYYNAEACKRANHVLLDGYKIAQCVEYCISEGWARFYKVNALGKIRLNDFGEKQIIRRIGKIEVREVL